MTLRGKNQPIRATRAKGETDIVSERLSLPAGTTIDVPCSIE
jgi:hypothetical protein